MFVALKSDNWQPSDSDEDSPVQRNVLTICKSYKLSSLSYLMYAKAVLTEQIE